MKKTILGRIFEVQIPLRFEHKLGELKRFMFRRWNRFFFFF